MNKIFIAIIIAILLYAPMDSISKGVTRITTHKEEPILLYTDSNGNYVLPPHTKMINIDFLRGDSYVLKIYDTFYKSYILYRCSVRKSQSGSPMECVHKVGFSEYLD